MKTRIAFLFAIVLYFTATSQTVPSIAEGNPSAIKNTIAQTSANDENTFNENPYKFLFGVRVMPVISSIHVSAMPGGVIEPSSMMGYSYGGFLGYNLSNYIGLQVEAQYSSLSQKYRDRCYDRTVTLNYVDIPLILTVNTGINDPVNIHFDIGPQLSLQSGNHLKTTGNAVGEGDELEAVLNTMNYDYGISCGVGTDIALNSSRSMKLSLGYRGFFGLMNIDDKSKPISNSQYYIFDNSRIRTYSLYAGLTFAF